MRKIDIMVIDNDTKTVIGVAGGVSMLSTGDHDYDEDPRVMQCKDCGCWIATSHAFGGPKGIDPFGVCPTPTKRIFR